MIDGDFFGTVDGVLVNAYIEDGEKLEDGELHAYVKYITEKHGRKPNALTIDISRREAALKAEFKNQPFERIRRITGYLVGTTDRWNNAKRAEGEDRVKHIVGIETEDESHADE
jgi:hypothetical protein